MNITELIEKETNTVFRKAGKENHGSCPFCHCAGNHFVIFPNEGRYWCRGCNKKGDAIQFLRDYKNLSFRQASEELGVYNISDRNDTNDRSDSNDSNDRHSHTPPLAPPSETWIVRAETFRAECQAALWGPTGVKVLAWLHSRGLSDDTIRNAGLGYCPADSYSNRQEWGLPEERTEQGRVKGLWLPRGVVIPWMIDGVLWGLRTRRPVGDPKYYWLPGGTANILYNADRILSGQPVALLEGEIDALTVCQNGFAGVATGSTHAARRTRWTARLSLASTVLIAYDSDEAGDKAAAYWLDALRNAKRWRPYWSDANQLQQDGVNVGKWIRAGLGLSQITSWYEAQQVYSELLQRDRVGTLDNQGYALAWQIIEGWGDVKQFSL